jgi:hypothetical protein
MNEFRGLQQWLSRIESKVDDLMKTNFTKDDMEIFKRDICSPSRLSSIETRKEVNKLKYFQAKIYGIVTAVTVIWGILIAVIEIKVNAHH